MNRHPTITNQFSAYHYVSAMLSCLINDILAKLTSSIKQGASELGSLGAGNCRRRSKTGRAVTTFADARGLRTEGRTSLQLCQLCAGVFSSSMNLRKHPKQRAGRWRAAKYPLHDGLSNAKEQYYGTDPNDRDSDDDGVMDSAEVFWNADVDGDGKINALDPDSDNDGITDGTELGVTVPIPGTSTIGGTNVSAYMDDGGCLRKNFTADVDPSTKTNVTLCDTDGDGFYDGWVDDGDGVYEEGYGEYLGEDINYDGNRDSTEMDPNDRDTDDDGVADNYTFIGKQCQGHLDTDNDGIINALEADSDNDGLADAIEMGFTFADISYDTNRAKDIFFPDQNPKSKSDPLNPDTDDDGLLDGIEDADGDGAIDGDIDGDNFWDEEETWFETNPLRNDTDRDGLYDGSEDADHDGVVDDDETDPIKRDSDGDSLDDGDEINLYNCDPTNRDSDDDGLTDGQEVAGWTVAICWGDTKEAIGDPWNVTSDPNKIDTEGDGVTDFEEFNNGSDPNKNDTDGDGLTDYEELCFWEAFPIFAQMYGLDPKSQDLENPSSPTQFDKQPPFIENVEIGIYKTKDDKYYVEISGMVIDIFGIDWLYIRMETRDAKQVNLYGEQITTFKTSFKANYNRLLWDGYDLWVKACDVNGNEAKYKEHLDGVVEGIVNAVMKLLSEIAAAIAELASAFIDFIWAAISYMMDTVFKPIKDAIEDWINNILTTFNNEFEVLFNDDPTDDLDFNPFTAAFSLYDIIFDGIVVLTLIVVSIVLIAIGLLTLPYICLVGTLIGALIDFLSPMIMSAIGGFLSNNNENSLIAAIFNGDVMGIFNSLLSMCGSNFDLSSLSLKTILNKNDDETTTGDVASVGLNIGQIILCIFLVFMNLYVIIKLLQKTNVPLTGADSFGTPTNAPWPRDKKALWDAEDELGERKIGFLICCLGLIFSIISIGSNIAGVEFWDVFLAIWGLCISAIGAIYFFTGFKSFVTNNNEVISKTEKIVVIGDLVLGSIALATSILIK